ncbi:MAG TPA: MliC family protein [Vicinamibacterales bacterium]
MGTAFFRLTLRRATCVAGGLFAAAVPLVSAQQPRTTPADTTPSSKTVTFVCEDKTTLTIEFMANLSTSATSYARVVHGTGAWMLPQVRSGSGARYAADGVSVWNKGNDVMFERGNTKLNCAVAGGELVGSSWRLVEVQSSDDTIGRVKPDDPSKYTLSLGADGRAAMRLNCNRATGPWSSRANGADSGSFSLGPLAVTKALCAPPSLDQRIARDAEYIRSYVLRDGRLYLNLTADGGTYVWARQ